MSSNVATVTVSAPTYSTKTSLKSYPNPSDYGQAVTFTARVTSTTKSSGIPTGTVNFFLATATIPFGTGTLDTSGSTSINTDASYYLPVGSDAITAVYVGYGNFGSSTSKPLTQTVDYRTTTALTSVTPNPSTLGQSVTFTAHVNVKPPGTGFPTGGTVTFYDGWNSIGSAVKVSTIDGSAGLSYSGLSAGSHNISAVYSGYGNYESSKSSIITQTVIGPLLIKTSSLPNGAINKYYNQSLSASGGVPKYTLVDNIRCSTEWLNLEHLYRRDHR